MILARATVAEPAMLTERDDGRTIEVQVGDRLVLELPQIAGTGYRWTLDGPVPEALEVREESFRARSNPLGSGGTAAWTLVARALRRGAPAQALAVVGR